MGGILQSSGSKRASSMDYVSELTALFDDVGKRSKPLSQREPITKLLDVLLEEVIEHIRPDLILEVGAFEASFSQKMKRNYSKSTVIALEANPRVFEHFHSSVERTGVKYKHIAAAANPGIVDIHIPKIIAGKDMPKVGRMGSLFEVGLRDSVTETVKVPCDTIDNILEREVFDRGCIWIDVEGLLKKVIDGAMNTLPRCEIIYAEMETSPVWKGQTLAYENISRIESMGFELIARDCQKWFQFNALFLRKGLAKEIGLISRLADFNTAAKSLFLQD
jgi:FkbM family methyltransferase